MTGKNWFSRHIVAIDPNPEPAHPNAPFAQPAEDFAADSRAEVTAPKQVQR